ncbi:MAG TPA: amino acid dehydrogenase [Tissierellia bacterium]|nr:amino acid dehydrogenase [Tissierellia bacterium]
MKSLFEPLKNEGLTTLKIRYNYKNKNVLLEASKQWSDNVKWSMYNKEFYMDDILTEDGIYLNHQEVISLFNKYNLADYLNAVIDLVKKGKHFGIDCFYNKNKNIRFIGNIHSNVQGINNRSHAVRSGGIRRHDLETPEIEVIQDGLNLARAMSFKNVGAGIPYGGCKITVHSKPVDLNDLEELGFLAYAIDKLRCFTGPDMGYPYQLADKLKEHFTINITGGENSPIGPTGGPTAYGVYLAIKQAAKFVFGSDSLANLKVALQGLGAVGYPLAEHLLKEDVQLFVSDLLDENLEKLQKNYRDKKIKVIEPEDIYYVEADIFAPCAIGGIVDENVIEKSKFKIIMGAANNQLKASTQEEEYRLARLLAQRNIVFQCDWVHNVAGVLAGWEEYRNQEKADIKNIITKIETLCRDNTWNNLQRAKDLNLTPTEIAYKEAEKLIYQ